MEHDEEAIRKADHIIDIGPNAGLNGGQVVAEGKLNDIINNKNSLTSLYLTGKKNCSTKKKKNYG